MDATDRLARIQSQIAASGRPGARLIAVSKGQPAAAVRALYDAGQRDFGENYVQELTAKAAELADLPDLRWHFLGQLQSNKLQGLVRVAAAVQSLGSERHARLLAERVAAAGKAPFPVHLLVNARAEATKHGLAMTEVQPLAAVIAAELPSLRLRGLMAIPPPLPPDAGANPPPLYLSLRALADQTGEGDLSLGMSGDLALALAAGSDCVRIGTALFGPRSPMGR